MLSCPFCLSCDIFSMSKRLVVLVHEKRLSTDLSPRYCSLLMLLDANWHQVQNAFEKARLASTQPRVAVIGAGPSGDQTTTVSRAYIEMFSMKKKTRVPWLGGFPTLHVIYMTSRSIDSEFNFCSVIYDKPYFVKSSR